MKILSFAMLFFAICFLTTRVALCNEEVRFKKIGVDGSIWQLKEIKSSVIRPTVYPFLITNANGKITRKCVDEEYVVKHFCLSRKNKEDSQIVWNAEESYLKCLGEPVSGISPHFRPSVWDVLEFDDMVFVLCSENRHLRVDAQKRNKDGQWINAMSYPLNSISSFYFEGKLVASPKGVIIRTAQWNMYNPNDKQVKVFEITQDGIRECPTMEIPNQD